MAFRREAFGNLASAVCSFTKVRRICTPSGQREENILRLVFVLRLLIVSVRSFQ